VSREGEVTVPSALRFGDLFRCLFTIYDSAVELAMMRFARCSELHQEGPATLIYRCTTSTSKHYLVRYSS